MHLYVQNAFLACWCTPQSPQTMKMIFHGTVPSGFFHIDTFRTFHNFCTPFRFIVWNYFLKIFIRIRYIQDAGKNILFMIFSNILDKIWIRIHFILYQYYGNRRTTCFKKTGQLFREYGFLYISMIQLRK